MTTIRKILFTCLVFVLPLQVHAEGSPLYLNFGVSTFTPDGGGYSLDGYSAGLGFDLNNFLGLEARYYNSSANTDLVGPAADPKLAYMTTVLGRLNLRFDNFVLYFLGGGYTAKGDMVISKASLTIDGEVESKGLAAGIGMSFFGTPDTSLDLRWLRVIDKDESEFYMDTITFGMHFYFDVPQIHGRY